MNEEGKRLAHIVKRTHKRLRRRYREEHDEQTVWAEHVRRETELQRYSQSMVTLATQHWQSRSHQVTSRVEWCYQALSQYYRGQGLSQAREKEARKMAYLNLPPLYASPPSPSTTSQLRVLDVGSCYDPFSVYQDLEVTAIDLCPGSESVKKGDFLNIRVLEPDRGEDPYRITSEENRAVTPGHVQKMGGKVVEEDTDDVNTKQISVVTPEQGNRLKSENDKGKLPGMDSEDFNSVTPEQGKKMGCGVEEEGLDCITFETRKEVGCEVEGVDLNRVAPEKNCTDTPEDGKKRKTVLGPVKPSEAPTLHPRPSEVPTTAMEPVKCSGQPTEPLQPLELPRESIQPSELPTEPMQPPELLKESVQPSELSTVPQISTLPGSFYDVVIFSLFLEYLPSPSQRLACCHKAYRLLKPGGILVLITPDSKHQNANAHLYKLWRLSLGFLGFSRVKYEKCRHFHGLLVRKALCRDAYVKDAERQLESMRSVRVKGKFAGIDYEKVKYEMYIPQDFKEDSSDSSNEN